jgi:hypothetical protein
MVMFEVFASASRSMTYVSPSVPAYGAEPKSSAHVPPPRHSALLAQAASG